MNYPIITVAGMMFNVLRESIALNDSVDLALLNMEGSADFYNVQLNPPLSESLALADYDANLPAWKQQFLEKAKTLLVPHEDTCFLIGYEIGQLATWLIGTMPNMTEFPDVDGRIAKALASIEVIEGLCAECEDPIAVKRMLESTTNAIRACTNMGDLKRAADMILQWKESGAMFNFA